MSGEKLRDHQKYIAFMRIKEPERSLRYFSHTLQTAQLVPEYRHALEAMIQRYKSKRCVDK